ncbi:hypothetical protein BDC45DRAFT_537096 [Circinella umbellata]|nr:hypothetical protein BDC45DRAFT_537096 [Circinella umbellata]
MYFEKVLQLMTTLHMIVLFRQQEENVSGLVLATKHLVEVHSDKAPTPTPNMPTSASSSLSPINEQEHDVNEILETVDVDDPTASETSYQQRELAESKEYLRKLVIMMKRKKKILDFNDKQMIQSQKVQVLRTSKYFSAKRH